MVSLVPLGNDRVQWTAIMDAGAVTFSPRSGLLT
jgi:hypothetical protein